MMLIKCTILFVFIIYIRNVLSSNPTCTPLNDSDSKILENILAGDSVLNPNYHKYLELCYKYDWCKDEKSKALYLSYLEVVIQLDKIAPNFKSLNETIQNALKKNDKTTTAAAFCDKMKAIFPKSMVFNSVPMCSVCCYEVSKVTNKVSPEAHIKPVCQILDLMADALHKPNIIEEQNKLINQNSSTAKKVSVAYIPKQVGQISVDQVKPLATEEIKIAITKPKIKQEPDLTSQQQQQPDSLPPKVETAVKPVITDQIIGASKKLPDVGVSIDISKASDKKTDPVEASKQKDSTYTLNLEKINPINDNNGGDDSENPDNDEDIGDGYNSYDTDTNKLNKGTIQPELPDTKDELTNSKPQLDDTFDETFKSNAINNNNENIVKTDPFYEKSGTHLFTYLLIGMFGCILLYVAYHNKTKILALLLEGRRGHKGRNGRRKHTAAYRKLDTNLEEAISSPSSARSSQIIY